MASSPRVITRVEQTGGASPSGTDVLLVLAPVASNADGVPRRFGSAAAVVTQHGYSEGAEYVALHAQRTRKPVLFCGLPIATAGAISRQSTAGRFTGTSVTTLAAGQNGVLTEHEGALKGKTSGTIGTDQIVIEYSLDGGRTYKTHRLGTAASFVIPDVGVTVSFAAGTVVAGETIHTWFGSAPLCDAAGIAAAFVKLAEGQDFFRSALLIGDCLTDDQADALLQALNGYETSVGRFAYGRASVYDREPQASMTRTQVRMTGTPTLTFTEVGATGDTITRSTGSWVADGFVNGDTITVTGSSGNNVTGVVATVSALVLTLDTTDLVAEGPVSGCAVVGTPTLTFAEVGATADTITRSRGSWLTDGFRDGCTISITGTASNNITSAAVTTVSATVLTLDTQDLAAESIGSFGVSVAAGQTKAAWVAEIAAEFATIDAAPRISLCAGRGRVLSPYSSWRFRRPSAWAVTLREYESLDLHIAPWRKSDGPIRFDLYAADGTLAEYDDRVDGGACTAARFTSMRTWSNGPRGAFIAQSLTRATDGTLQAHTHNQAVVDLGCMTVQLATEDFVGRSLLVSDDGAATSDSLSTLESEVNSALAKSVLVNKGAGLRASNAYWVASRDDDMLVPEPVLTGVLTLTLNGTVHSVTTTVRVPTGGVS